MNEALLVLDVQNVMFMPEYNLHNAEVVLRNIQLLINHARDKGIPIIYIQHTGEVGGLLEEYSEPWEIHPLIQPASDDIVIEKMSWDSFYETNLKEKLESLGVKKLIICGMQTQFCVDTVCRTAYSHGYHSLLAKDAHSTFDTDLLEASTIISHHNDILGGRFVTLKSTSEIIA